MAETHATAIIYARVSTKKQADAETIQAQITRCKALVERRGLRLLPYGPKADGIIADDGITGTLLAGRAFADLIADIEQARVRPDYIVIYSMSRISRIDRTSKKLKKLQDSYGDAARIQSALLARGVCLLDEDGEIKPGTPMYAIKTLFATEDRAEILKRTTDGKTRRLADGQFARGGRPPYGYRQVRTDKEKGWRVEVDEGDSKRLLQVLEWFCAHGYTRAAKMATEAGYPIPRERMKGTEAKTVWHATTVEYLVDKAGVYLSGELTIMMAGQPHVVKFPSLIDHALYTRIERKVKEGTLKKRAVFLSTGYLRCSCETNLYVRQFSRYHHVRCEKCKLSIRQRTFETKLYAAMGCRLIQLEQRTQAATPEDDTKKLDELRHQIEAVNATIDRLYDDRADLDRDIWKKRNGILNDQKHRLQAEVERIKAEREVLAKKQVQQESLAMRVRSLIAAMAQPERLSLDQRRQILGDLLGGERLRVTWQKAADGTTYAHLTWPPIAGAPEVVVSTLGRMMPQFFAGEVAPKHFTPVWDQ